MLRTVISLFDDVAEAREVVKELVEAGFKREDISLLTNNAEDEPTSYAASDEESGAVAKGAGFGAVIGGMGGLLIGLTTVAIPGVGPIIAAGPLAIALSGAGIGTVTGSLIGAALVEIGVPEEDAPIYAEGVQRGGTLVIVKVTDKMSDRAASVMGSHHSVEVK